MSSSLTPWAAARHDAPGGLLATLGAVPDPRDPRGVRHALPVVLAMTAAAVLAGARSFTTIGEWVADQGQDVMKQLGAAGSERPSESTIRRVLTSVDGQVLDQLIGAFVWTRSAVIDQRRVIAIDGKTIRGARSRHDPDQGTPHLVAALDHHAGAVLGQVAVSAKSNEIPAVRTLLASFDLTGAVVTVDAMHTQTDTAQMIIEAGGAYVFTVKNNQPSLYAACKDLPWAEVPGHSTLTTGHGRRARRTIKVVQAPRLGPVPRRAPDRPDPAHRDPSRQQDRRGRVRHHLRRPPDGPTGHPRRVGERPLGHRKPAPLGPRRHLRRRPLPSPHRTRTPRHGHLPQHRNQPAPDDRLDLHRRRPPTSRPTPRTDPHMPTDVLKRDFAGALATSPSTTGSSRRTTNSPFQSLYIVSIYCYCNQNNSESAVNGQEAHGCRGEWLSTERRGFGAG